MQRFDPLESRRLFSVTSVLDANGILQITGTSGDDSVSVQLIASGTIVAVNGNTAANLDQVHGINASLGDGNDSISVDVTSSLPVTMRGGAGNDTLSGGGSATVFDGGAGSDSISGSGGVIDERDVAGNLTVTKSSATAGSDHDRFSGSFTALYSGSGNDTIDLQHDVSGTSSSIDAVNAGAGNDTIYGGNFVFGGDGDDFISGNGQIDAGAGNDTVHAGAGAGVRGGDGDDLIVSANPAGLADGGAGDDTVIFTAATVNFRTSAYQIRNGLLNLSGTASADQISVRPHSTGGYLDVTTNGDLVRLLGTTSIDVHAGDGDDRVSIDSRIALPTELYGEAGNDTLLGGGAADRIYGGDGNDDLYGYGGNDILYGEAGNDRVFGGAGRDHLDGGVGTNVLRGEDGSDVIAYRTGDDIRGNTDDRLILET